MRGQSMSEFFGGTFASYPGSGSMNRTKGWSASGSDYSSGTSYTNTRTSSSGSGWFVSSGASDAWSASGTPAGEEVNWSYNFNFGPAAEPTRTGS